ncbi:Structural maintenance of chromosomes protein 2 [Papilio machaon]|uniref:Structural maintenance of chromosomes protein 2 n=1 Tax=Papilio machaon TaxID=76193 RepID=A0A194RJF7_PAPMA|nr:Structural maintenance of chromosomes protein 2 [Papilio machaon]
MYIKSIVLDGFKSYGNRVEVTGFDPEFNAITGLNGTGKSNILDSICFVLGITNLSNVRAGSLQELIYKHGQAGIIKATVSITFDNRDKRQCPVGYENHDEITVTRQVVMGGKNKYLINGINVQNKRVSDMFCSVQLNVNNPHFLIMQGRITKVLNMKPPEILSMVEEAAGTRMYEAKKQAAQKTIEKKDAKLRELNDIIKEDIAPKLQKLQDERYQFQEYQKVVREVENLSRLCTAWTYVQAQQAAEEAAERAAQAQRDITNKREEIAANCAGVLQLEEQMAALNRRLEEESALGGLREALGGAERAEAACAAEVRGAREAEAAHAARARLLARALHDDTAALRTKEEELLAVSSRFESLKSASEASAAALAEAQARFLAVSTGLEGGSESLQDRLMAAKQEASEAATRMAQSRMQQEHAQGRLRALQREAGASGAQHARDQRDIAEHQAQLDRLQEEMSRLGFDEERCETLVRRSRSLAGETRARREAAEALGARLQRCDFRYQPPQTNFDHGRVAGTVCRLVDVKDPKYCTALETAAGGRLYNVVVDTEVTSKLLLERGQLQTRTTIIPLNKISARVIDRDTLRVAQEVGGGADKVQLALDLVSFPERVRAAMSWVFGGALVCADLDTARRVTFHPRVRCRCVTLDGDVVDPAGTLSGGARIKGGSVLLQLQVLKQLEAAAREAEEELAACTADLANLQLLADKHNALKQKVEVSSHALQVLRARVAATAHAQLHDEIDALQKQVEELGAALERDQRTQREAAARAADLEAKVRDIKGHREREFKKAEEALRKAKLDAESDSASWKRREQEFETLKLEVAELRQAAAAGELQLVEGERLAADLQQALLHATDTHKEAAEKVKGLQTKIKQKKAEIASKNADVARLASKVDVLVRTNGDLELAIKRLEFSAKELQAEAATCQKKIKSLEESNSWSCPAVPWPAAAHLSLGDATNEVQRDLLTLGQLIPSKACHLFMIRREPPPTGDPADPITQSELRIILFSEQILKIYKNSFAIDSRV